MCGACGTSGCGTQTLSLEFLHPQLGGKSCAISPTGWSPLVASGPTPPHFIYTFSSLIPHRGRHSPQVLAAPMCQACGTEHPSNGPFWNTALPPPNTDTQPAARFPGLHECKGLALTILLWVCLTSMQPPGAPGRGRGSLTPCPPPLPVDPAPPHLPPRGCVPTGSTLPAIAVSLLNPSVQQAATETCAGAHTLEPQKVLCAQNVTADTALQNGGRLHPWCSWDLKPGEELGHGFSQRQLPISSASAADGREVIMLSAPSRLPCPDLAAGETPSGLRAGAGHGSMGPRVHGSTGPEEGSPAVALLPKLHPPRLQGPAPCGAHPSSWPDPGLMAQPRAPEVAAGAELGARGLHVSSFTPRPQMRLHQSVSLSRGSWWAESPHGLPHTGAPAPGGSGKGHEL